MQRLTFILPGLLEVENAWDLADLPNLRRLSEGSEISRLEPLEPGEMAESGWLGFRRNEVRLSQGPLIISALGADPPPRSTHFHLSALSLHQGVIDECAQVTPDDERNLAAQFERLNSKNLTIVNGILPDYGLVWERLADVHTASPMELLVDGWKKSLPEGEGDQRLRRFIEDSVNLLDDFEWNRRRIDEGLAPVNLLWPWGNGVREPVPNLALRRGEPTRVVSRSLRVRGLARLARYLPDDRRAMDAKFKMDWGGLLEKLAGNLALIVVWDHPGELAAQSRLEEVHWLLRQWDDEFLAKLPQEGEPLQLGMMLAPSETPGIGLFYSSKDKVVARLPFDFRALEEAKVDRLSAESLVIRTLSPHSS